MKVKRDFNTITIKSITREDFSLLAHIAHNEDVPLMFEDNLCENVKELQSKLKKCF